jgi:hypothetical protein
MARVNSLSFSRTVLTYPFEIELDRIHPVTVHSFSLGQIPEKRGIAHNVKDPPARSAVEVTMRGGARIEPFLVGVDVEFLDLSRLREFRQGVIHRRERYARIFFENFAMYALRGGMRRIASFPRTSQANA